MNTTNKQRLETVLAGRVPDRPPHFEIDFHLAKELFGLECRGEDAPSRLDFHIEVQRQLVEQFGYASVYFSPDHPPEQGITKVKDALGSQALVRSHEWDGVFWMPTGEDMVDFATRLYEQPDELHAEARRKCEAAKERLRIHADAGADFFLLCYDFGFNKGPFISPAQFNDLVVPYLTEIVQTAHDLGKKAMLHSDGDLNLLLDQIHSTGADGYQSVDPQGGMDIKAVREKFPDWILMGNINCSMLQRANETQIRESVRYCLRHGGVGRPYIFSTSNCIYPGMPPESYRIMLDEYVNFCESCEGISERSQTPTPRCASSPSAE